MAKKLAFLSISPTAWKLAYESAICTALFFAVFVSDFHILTLIAFGGTALFFYFRSAGKPRRITASFWILIVWSLSTLYFLSSIPQSGMPFRSYKIVFLMAIFSIATYILFGLARFFFKNPDFVYEIFSAFLVLATGALLFFMSGPWGVWITSGLLFLAIFLLCRESFNQCCNSQSVICNLQSAIGKKRVFAMSFAAALLSMELFIVLSLLPMNFISNGAVLALFFLTIRYIILSHYDGIIHARILFNRISVFVIVLLVILALSRFSL